MDALRAGDFDGATGRIKFAEYKNDRRAYGYEMINMQNGERKVFAIYNTTDA